MQPTQVSRQLEKYRSYVGGTAGAPQVSVLDLKSGRNRPYQYQGVLSQGKHPARGRKLSYCSGGWHSTCSQRVLHSQRSCFEKSERAESSDTVPLWETYWETQYFFIKRKKNRCEWEHSEKLQVNPFNEGSWMPHRCRMGLSRGVSGAGAQRAREVPLNRMANGTAPS